MLRVTRERLPLVCQRRCVNDLAGARALWQSRIDPAPIHYRPASPGKRMADQANGVHGFVVESSVRARTPGALAQDVAIRPANQRPQGAERGR